MLRRQFLQIITDLRAELERATEPAADVSDSPTLKQKINRVYETLYADYDWPHLVRAFAAISLNKDQRYYDLPEDMDYDRLVEKPVVWNNNLPIPLERGIEMQDYATYNSENGDTGDPAVKWDIRYDDTGNKEVIEFWPIPASTGSYTAQFRGIQKFARLVDDDDVCRLDDQLVILFAAAELSPAKSGNKQLFLQAANKRLFQMRGRAKAGGERVKIGGGGGSHPNPYRAVVLISGA